MIFAGRTPRSRAGASEEDGSDLCRMLGRFEELVLLATIACGQRASAAAISDKIRRHLGGERTRTTIMTTLERLEEKGLVRIEEAREGEAPRVGRGAPVRNVYSATDDGYVDLRKSIAVKETLLVEAGMGEVARAA